MQFIPCSFDKNDELMTIMIVMVIAVTTDSKNRAP